MKAWKLFLLMFLGGLFTWCASSNMALADGGTVGASDFFMQVVESIKAFGGMATAVKISAVVTLLISSMKVSVLNKYVWDRLGEGQILVAPLLGLLVGISGLVSSGGSLSLPTLFAYLMTGGGAVFLHELLDGAKALPGLGAVYVKAIGAVEGVLGGGGGPAA